MTRKLAILMISFLCMMPGILVSGAKVAALHASTGGIAVLASVAT
jgi:hypothetical protein